MKIPWDLPGVLRDGRRVFIQTHDFPDPDALASAYGLKSLLRHYGLNATLCYKGYIEALDVMHLIGAYGIDILECSQIAGMDRQDKIILADGQKFNANMTDLPGDEVACIDHHPANEKCAYLYEDIRNCGACSSIIASYFVGAGIPLDEKTATLLLYGLRTDTANMTRGVTGLDIDAFKTLFPLADKNMLRQLEGRTMSAQDLLAFGKAIETILISRRIGIALIPFDCADYIIAQVSDFILRISEVDIAIVYARRAGGIKFSARTVLPQVHCGHLLKECLSAEGGIGGGHAHMAGGFLPREKAPALYDQELSLEKKKRNAAEFSKHLAERFSRFLFP